MTLDGAAIRAGLAAVNAIGKQMRSFDELAAGATDVLAKVPGLTNEGAAAALATGAVESAWFRTTREYHGERATYSPYFGRGIVQLTHKNNYAEFSAWCHARELVNSPDYFVRNPTALEDYRWAWLTLDFYFAANGIWKWANAGNFRAVSQAVNGGNGRVGTSFVPNGWAERQKMYDAFLRIGVLPNVTEDHDDMPTAQEIANAILDTPITRQGDGIPPALRGGKTSLRNEIAWLTNAMINAPWSDPGVGAAIARQVAGMAAGHASAPDELRALREQLAQVEQRLTDALTTRQAGVPR